MQGPDRARVRALACSGAALIALLLATVLVPSTSSAFTALITNTSDSAASKARFLCEDTFAGDRRRSSAYFEFALSEPAGATVAVDSSDAHNAGTYRGSNTKDGTSEKAAAAAVACPNDGGSAYRLDGSSSRISSDKQYQPITGSFSEEAWFKTSAPGKILGFESSSDDRSSNYDKHLYVGASGRLVFGIYNGSIQTLSSPASVADGLWHYAVATTSSDGSRLYVDGVQVDSNPNYVTAESFCGFWRIGWGNLDSWPDAPGGNNWFTGSVRFAAAYPYVLSSQEIASAWSIGKPGAVGKSDPTPTVTATPEATVTATPDATATATPAASDSPAPSTTATTGPGPVKSGSEPTYAPAPGTSEISTADPTS